MTTVTIIIVVTCMSCKSDILFDSTTTMYFMYIQVPVSAWWKAGATFFNVVCCSGKLVETNFNYDESSNQWRFDKSRTSIEIGKYNEEKKRK